MLFKFYMLFKKRAKKTNTREINLSLINDKVSKHEVGQQSDNNFDIILNLEKNNKRIEKLEREFKKLYMKKLISNRY